MKLFNYNVRLKTENLKFVGMVALILIAPLPIGYIVSLHTFYEFNPNLILGQAPTLGWLSMWAFGAMVGIGFLLLAFVILGGLGILITSIFEIERVE